MCVELISAAPQARPNVWLNTWTLGRFWLGGAVEFGIEMKTADPFQSQSNHIRSFVPGLQGLKGCLGTLYFLDIVPKKIGPIETLEFPHGFYFF